MQMEADEKVMGVQQDWVQCWPSNPKSKPPVVQPEVESQAVATDQLITWVTSSKHLELAVPQCAHLTKAMTVALNLMALMWELNENEFMQSSEQTVLDISCYYYYYY